MFKAVSTFTSKMAGLELGQIAFNSDRAPGAIAELGVTEADGVKITVMIPTAMTPDAGKQEAAVIANELLDRLVFVTQRSSGPLRHDSSSVQELDGHGSPTGEVKLSATVYISETLNVTLNKGNPEFIQREIMRLDGDLDPLYGIYRNALNAEDSVHRFMALYSVLLLVCGDSQGKLDAFVRQHAPGVPESPSPKFEGKQETVFTRLRNEIGHVRKGVKLDETREGMRQRVDQLSALTRVAINLYGPEMLAS